MSKILDSIDKHFPFKEFNPGQKDAILQCVESVMAGKRHTVLSCPTGVGKSVIAMTVHNVLNEIYSRGDFSSVILATTKGLQDQYNMDFARELVDLKGKTNYFCHHNIFEGYNSPRCIEKVMSQECSPDRCEYVFARDKWSRHNGAKTTNSALMIASKNIIPIDNPEDLCIIDECHEIDKVLISQSTIKFNIDDYPAVIKHYPDFKDEYYNFILTMMAYFPDSAGFTVADALKTDEARTLDRFTHIVSSAHTTVSAGLREVSKKNYKFVLIQRDLADLLDKLDYMKNKMYNDLEWIMNIDEEGSVILVPIRSSGVLSELKLFRKAKQFIHMSATIGGIDTYCKNLGIDKSEITYIDIDNPIPIESRQIYLSNLIKINRYTEPSEIVNAIVPIIESNTGNGIIHTVSFKLAWDILKNSPPDIKRRILISNNRKEILDTLERGKNKIILSPSVETGYDFKDDLARWQIIAKVPFLNLGDNYVTVRKDKNNDWYTREAVLRLVQSCGRIVRGLNDYGNTYIIDENVLRLITDNTEMFPDWWLNALEI